MERGSLLDSTNVGSVEFSSTKKTPVVSRSVILSNIIVLVGSTLLLFTVASANLTELSEHISLKTLHNH